MQATLGAARTQIKRETRKTDIPNNDIAKLMYYLDCLCCVLECDIGSNLTDYQNYYNLTQEEEDTVVKLAFLFNPKLLIDLKIFILDSRLLLGEFSNEFYKITDEKIGIHVNEQVMIEGKSLRVLKIMACDQNWLRNYYYKPIMNLNNRESNDYLPTTSNFKNYYPSPSYDNNSGCCDCIKKNKKSCIITIVIIVIIAVINIIYYAFINKKSKED